MTNPYTQEKTALIDLNAANVTEPAAPPVTFNTQVQREIVRRLETFALRATQADPVDVAHIAKLLAAIASAEKNIREDESHNAKERDKEAAANAIDTFPEGTVIMTPDDLADARERLFGKLLEAVGEVPEGFDD